MRRGRAGRVPAEEQEGGVLVVRRPEEQSHTTRDQAGDHFLSTSPQWSSERSSEIDGRSIRSVELPVFVHYSFLLSSVPNKFVLCKKNPHVVASSSPSESDDDVTESSVVSRPSLQYLLLLDVAGMLSVS